MSNKVVIFVVWHFKTNFPVTAVIGCGCLTCWFTMNYMQMLKWQQMKIKISWAKRNITQMAMDKEIQRWNISLLISFGINALSLKSLIKLVNIFCYFMLRRYLCVFYYFVFNNPLCSLLLCLTYIEMLNLRASLIILNYWRFLLINSNLVIRLQYV